MNSPSRIEAFYNTFREISSIIHSSTDMDEVLELVVWKAAEALQAKGALLRVLNLETQQLELSAVYGMSKDYITKAPGLADKAVALLYREEKLIIIKDIADNPLVGYPQKLSKEGVQMIMDLPLKFRADVIGRLRIYFDTQRDFGEDEIDFALSLAAQCACAIDKVRLIQEQKIQYNKLALQTEKLSALGRMAAGIAHEINNPLAGILLYSSNLHKKVADDGPLKEGLGIIMRETQRCKIIIQELLEFSRDQEPQKTLADVNQIITKALSILQNEFHLRHITIEKQLSTDIPAGLMDENQLEQVFVNLLLNAVQAIESHGMVFIRSRMAPDGKNAIVEIKDTGCGIPADQIHKIFEPFFSTKSNGSGLGLAVSYGIIRNHQGQLEVESIPGKETRFVLSLPIQTKLG